MSAASANPLSDPRHAVAARRLEANLLLREWGSFVNRVAKAAEQERGSALRTRNLLSIGRIGLAAIPAIGFVALAFYLDNPIVAVGAFVIPVLIFSFLRLPPDRSLHLRRIAFLQSTIEALAPGAPKTARLTVKMQLDPNGSIPVVPWPKAGNAATESLKETWLEGRLTAGEDVRLSFQVKEAGTLTLALKKNRRGKTKRKATYRLATAMSVKIRARRDRCRAHSRAPAQTHEGEDIKEVSLKEDGAWWSATASSTAKRKFAVRQVSQYQAALHAASEGKANTLALPAAALLTLVELAEGQLEPVHTPPSTKRPT